MSISPYGEIRNVSSGFHVIVLLQLLFCINNKSIICADFGSVYFDVLLFEVVSPGAMSFLKIFSGKNFVWHVSVHGI